MEKDKYSGQALIMVMIVLIIGAIIALAIAVRSIKSQEKVIEEERSSESYNIASSLISYSQSISDEDFVAALQSADCIDQDECCFVGGDIAGLADTTLSDAFTCSELGGVSTNLSEIKFCISEIGEFADMEVPKDSTVAIPFLTAHPGCSLRFRFTPQVGDSGGIVLKRIYANKDADGFPIEFKEYNSSDISSLSMGVNNNWSNWTTYTAGGVHPVDISPVGGFDLYEIRIMAVGSTMTMAMEDSDNCFDDPAYYRIVASANCTGEYRSLWYYKPVRETGSSLFDYTIFNNNGSFEFKL